MLSIIQTNVVRKEGKRPESPTVKLRTVLQKQKEEQDQQRAERARRRRGGDDGSGVDTSMGDVSADGYRSETRATKHRRGPGEDEDYESPEHPSGPKKRVKWDPDLGTAAFLDEIHVNPAGRARGKARKSCFTGDTRVRHFIY